ncbi:MAG: class A beta-lactamase [Acidobacteriia bacterium]|nr:class A beta-lactamase [Terriglobia bacterium]
MKLTRRESLLMLSAGMAVGSESPLELEWRRIARATDGRVGAAALHLASGRHASLNGDERFPMASVCKLPIAIHMLSLVDEGKLQLNQPIEVLAQDIFPQVSEIAGRWPKQRQFRLDELVRLMVAQSDNTVGETLFRIGGGAPALAARFRTWRVEGVRVDRAEEEIALEGIQAPYPPREQWTGAMYKRLMSQATPVVRARAMARYLADPRDTATPTGTVQLLARAFRGELLSKSTTGFLIETMKATTTGPARLKGLLPEGTVVAHKTGAWGTVNGLNGATNDVGVIFLPRRAGEIAVAVFVKGSTCRDAARDRVIAEVARAAYDSWAGAGRG